MSDPIEPGEKEVLDYEFAIPTDVQVVRIYAFIQNDDLTRLRGTPYGWNYPLLYDFRKDSSKEVPK